MASTGTAAETAVAAVSSWVRRVWAGETEPALGAPGRAGWWAPTLPFSFQYGGRPAADLLPQWHRRTAIREGGDGRTLHSVALTDPATGLEVTWEATTYADTPAVEWLLSFRNAGTASAPILEQVRALDLVLATDYHELLVYHATGSHATPDAFEPHQTVLLTAELQDLWLSRGQPFRLASVGGRSANGVLPFFNVEATWDGYRGVVVAVGWTGQWEAQLTRFRAAPPPPVEPDLRGPHPQLSALRSANRLRIEAGMEGVHLSLQAGEQIRTPRILLIPWEGDRFQGQNLLRRLLHHHVAPKLDGAPPLPAIWSNLGIVDPKQQLLGGGWRHPEAISQVAAMGVDSIVIDAGWYPSPGSWWQGVGNYTVRKDIFPDGLRPIADAVHREGKRFGLWFEPERVYEGTEVFREHRDWLYPTLTARGQSYLLNFGIPEARQWITDTVSRLIDEIGIDWYRHDANADFLPVWQANDAPDRQGISEIRHVEGLYQFWAGLMARHPGLYMEGCSSGTRRMDYESLRYHHSCWLTDWMVGDPAGLQSIVHGASQWLPGNYFNQVLGNQGGPLVDTPAQRYGLFSALGGGIVVGWRVLNTKAPLDLALGRRWLTEFRALRHLAVGDFYPLLPHTLSEGEWLASQYDRPDLGEGMLVAFRRRHCPADTVVLLPRALDPEATYLLRYQSAGAQTERSGRALAAGLPVTLMQAPAHEVIRYRRR